MRNTLSKPGIEFGSELLNWIVRGLSEVFIEAGCSCKELKIENKTRLRCSHLSWLQ